MCLECEQHKLQDAVDSGNLVGVFVHTIGEHMEEAAQIVEPLKELRAGKTTLEDIGYGSASRGILEVGQGIVTSAILVAGTVIAAPGNTAIAAYYKGQEKYNESGIPEKLEEIKDNVVKKFRS